MPSDKNPNFDFENINHTLKDAAYVAIGLGVLGFQKAQVQRVELVKQGRAQFERISANRPDLPRTVDFAEMARSVDKALTPIIIQLDDRLDRFEENLPGPARNLVHSARTAANSGRDSLRSAVGLADRDAGPDTETDDTDDTED